MQAMSSIPAGQPVGTDNSNNSSDKLPSAPASAPAPTTSASSAAPKLRSCVVCRSRKVRCDKQSPCSNCRRANIPCVLPATNRPPRWARRLERVANAAAASAAAAAATASAPATGPGTGAHLAASGATAYPQQQAHPGVDQVTERLHTLERLVRDLTGQLEQARSLPSVSPAADGGSGSGSASAAPSPMGTGLDTDADSLYNAQHQRQDLRQRTSSMSPDTTSNSQFGRLVSKDPNRGRYVSSGFWSRVVDELDGLKIEAMPPTANDSGSSDDETSAPGKSTPSHELERAPLDRHAFLFRHNLGSVTPNLREFHPLPSQIPYILDVFSQNVNSVIRIVHVPTLNKALRSWRLYESSLSKANEALLFAIYYATLVSMEEEDVLTNFGATKDELTLKYRVGLEHALSTADFLNVPDIVLVQAFALFLFLVRRHDSPRYVWMMTGLVIRMAHALGLHRDGSQFEHLSAYEVEMRRRIWWALCMLDIRASEDQGMDLSITAGSFDTRLPLNINDADLDPDSTAPLTECEGLTDMTGSLISFGICEVGQRLAAANARSDHSNLEERDRLLNEIYDKYEKSYFQYSVDPASNILFWVWFNVARVVVAKLTLLTYLPALSSSQNAQHSNDIANKLLVSAIEIAECNHALNTEPEARQWRWAYQTYSHWHAIIILLIETSRRPWTPIIERAWFALHSAWLIPSQANMDKNLRFWLPLRKLMAKARKHRDSELERLQGNLQLAELLQEDDRRIPSPKSTGPFPSGADVTQLFRDRWRQLIGCAEERYRTQQLLQSSSASSDPASVSRIAVAQPVPIISPEYSQSSPQWNSNLAISEPGIAQPFSGIQLPNEVNESPASMQHMGAEQVSNTTHDSFSLPMHDWSDSRFLTDGFVPQLWGENDPSAHLFAEMDTMNNLELDNGMDWINWVQSAQGLERDGAGVAFGAT